MYFGSDNTRSGLWFVSCLENTVNAVNVVGPPQTRVGRCTNNKQMIVKIWKITALTRLDRATYQVISW